VVAAGISTTTEGLIAFSPKATSSAMWASEGLPTASIESGMAAI
jgi:hypothetical protein